MKLWLTKFRISAGLDSGRPLSESLRKKIAADPELEHFTRRAETLGPLLRTPSPADSSLHDGIMRAVRAAARRSKPQAAPVPAWLAAFAIGAAVVVISLLLVRPRAVPPRQSALDGPLLVLEMSEKMPAAMPSAMMAPLTNEWAKVNRDVQNTSEIVAAAFPFQIQ
jgi:hypothetical protein